MTLGSQIVAELARRQLTGCFFDYAGYQRLRHVTCPEELARFLEEFHYESPPPLESAEKAVDYLVAVEKRMSGTDDAWLLAALLTGLPLLDLLFLFVSLTLWTCRRWRKGL